MSFISHLPTIKCLKVSNATAEIEKRLRDSDAVRRCAEAVRNGNLSRKPFNYYRLPNAKPKGYDPSNGKWTKPVVRKNENLEYNGKLMLDLDGVPCERVYNKVKGHEMDWGVLHLERSISGKGCHLDVKMIEGLTPQQMIAYWSHLLDEPIDPLYDMARACFLVPNEDVLYVSPEYWEPVVKPMGMEAVDCPDYEVLIEHDNYIEKRSYEPKAPLMVTDTACGGYRSTYEDNALELKHLISNVIEPNCIDITRLEPDWFRLGCVCYSILGEVEGREYFHRLSQFYPGYSWSTCNAKYNHIVAKNYNQASMGTFVSLLYKQLN